VTGGREGLDFVFVTFCYGKLLLVFCCHRVVFSKIVQGFVLLDLVVDLQKEAPVVETRKEEGRQEQEELWQWL
jgi:hypothetical protein